jgi:predicted HTH transcriptional regulator
LSNIASENVSPSILINVETIAITGGSLVVAHIKEGVNKPYHDNRGIVWVKNGADKRRVFDNAELAEMMTECGSFAPDEAEVRDATLSDLDSKTLKLYLSNKFSKVLERKDLMGDALNEASLESVCSAIAHGYDAERLLRNLRFIHPNGRLTVAAMLLFGKYTQRWLPVMTAKCICFAGNSIGGTVFRDKVNDNDIEGNLLHQFETIMSFFTRNLRNVQVGEEFNSLGQLEIPYKSLLEFTVNALVHRSLNINAPIRIFIFDNRVEIHSPGTLPNGLQVEDVMGGTSMPRNSFLFNNAIYLLPYTGAGSGMSRALEDGLKVEFKNDERSREFVIIIPRKSISDLDTLEGDLDTGLRHSDTQKEDNSSENTSDLDTKSSNLDTLEGDLDTGLRHLDTQRRKISKKEQDIVSFCSVPRSAKEILDRAGVTMHSKNREKYITSLVDAGYLEMTNPENPNASNQKYRKRAK